ncbi:MAG: ROK family protein [Qipengyuania sp.]|nr:ROK family protein [Qipengyuania sp.]
MIGAVEAGGTKFVLALANHDGAIVDQTIIATRSPGETFSEMYEWFAAGEARHGRIGAFGVGSFGPIGLDPTKPDFASFTTTPKPGWSGASFVEALASFQAPINLETDVNAAALGEWLRGAGRGCGSLAYTTIGTGIGSGVLKDGAVLSGWSHYESGHLLVRRDPARDPFAGVCPFHGDCLEALASGPAIEARWGHDLSSASGKQIALVAEYAAQLAAALVLLHRPERLIFGGGVMKAPGMVEQLRLLTREKLAGYIAEWDENLTRRIVLPQLGDDAGITGAIELGRRALETRT